MRTSLFAFAALAVACGSTSSRVTSVDTGSDAGGTGASSAADAGTGGVAVDGGPVDSGVLSYSITDLGRADVAAIDELGRIAGATCDTPGSPCIGGVYTPGSGWSTAPVPAGAEFVEVVGIDAQNHLAVNASFPWIMGSDYRRAYLAAPLRPLSTANQVPQNSWINAMNASTGHVVGYDEALGGGFLYDGQSLISIAVQPGATFLAPSATQGVNVHDQVVGAMDADPKYSDRLHAFLWDHGKLIDLGGGVDPTCGSTATAINDSGVVVGITTSTSVGVNYRCDRNEVALWDDGGMHVLGCPANLIDCSPHAINARGDVVGKALIDVLTGQRAFIFHGGGFLWLDELVDGAGWKFESAVGMNNAGQIIGYGKLNAQDHAFLLTPR